MHLSDTDQATVEATVSARGKAKPTQVPARVGKYLIVRQAASGGFGTVYEAHDEQLQSRVAIKVPRYAADESVVKSMLEEARMHAKLRHPNIVRILAAEVQANHEIYIVMDWINGQTLRDLMARSRLSVPQALTIAQQVADAMHYAHRSGFVHRDLKPNNVLIDDDGKAYVTDFGLAINDVTQKEHRHEFAGTVAYMSPEQVRSQSQYLDGRADIWAIGVMLYEMLGGQRPFRGNYNELQDEILNREPKPLRLLNEEVSPSLEAIVNHCLEKEVRQRLPTARELSERLYTELHVARSSYERPAKQPNYNHAFYRAAIALSGCMLIVCMGLLWTRFDNSNSKPSSNLAASLPLASSTSKPKTSNGLIDTTNWMPGRWHKLLDRPLARLRMPQPGTGTMIIENPDLEEATLVVQGQMALGAGLINSRNFTVQFSISQPTWIGETSFFFGLRPTSAAGKSGSAATEFTCEELLLTAMPGLPTGKYRLNRLEHALDAEYLSRSTHAFDSVTIPNPGKRRIDCVLVVRDGQLSSVIWDGIPQPELFDNLIHRLKPQRTCDGGFGFFVRDTTVKISNLRILIDEQP